jgi:hypothetical protein
MDSRSFLRYDSIGRQRFVDFGLDTNGWRWPRNTSLLDDESLDLSAFLNVACLLRDAYVGHVGLRGGRCSRLGIGSRATASLGQRRLCVTRQSTYSSLTSIAVLEGRMIGIPVGGSTASGGCGSTSFAGDGKLGGEAKGS